MEFTYNQYKCTLCRRKKRYRPMIFCITQSNTNRFYWNSICDLVHFDEIWWQLYVGRRTQYICNSAIKIEPIYQQRGVRERCKLPQLGTG